MIASLDVEIRVEVADAFARRIPLLVVKHAQYSYGVDLALVKRLRIPDDDLPKPGAHLHVPSDERVGADSVLFIGLPSLPEFGYRDIREFGRRAVATAARVAPDIREIHVTLHGPGFGFDEAESFASEVAGIVQAIQEGQMPRGLQAVVFLERDPERADRMNQVLTQLKQGRNTPSGNGANGLFSSERLQTVGLDSSSRRHAFVAMPFHPEFDDTFHYGIERPIHAAGLLCERMDKMSFTGDVIQRLKDRIARATFVVADVSGANPNVYLEVGFAWGKAIPTVIICKEDSDLKFDVRGQRCLTYGSIRDLEVKLSREVGALFSAPIATNSR